MATTHHLSTSNTLHVIHHRRQLTAACLALCVAMALSAALRLTNLPVMATPLLGAALFLIHGLLDPSRQGFLHHRRLRYIGIGLTVLGATAVALIAPSGATPPLLFAMAIAYRHHRGGVALHLCAARELEDLKRKIVSLEARRLLELNLPPVHPISDKRRKAV